MIRRTPSSVQGRSLQGHGGGGGRWKLKTGYIIGILLCPSGPLIQSSETVTEGKQKTSPGDDNNVLSVPRSLGNTTQGSLNMLHDVMCSKRVKGTLHCWDITEHTYTH